MSALVGDILANSEDDQYAPRRAYTLLTSIEAAAPDLESVSQALATATSAHPDVADHAEDDATQEQSAWGTAPPTTVDELHEKVSQELEATAQALIACEAERSSYEDQRRWDHLADAISSTVQRWPEDGYALLDSVGPGHPEVDQAVVRGWATTQPDADLAAQILTRLTNLELEPILGYVTATLGGFASAGSPPGKWFRFAESVELAKKCWDTIDPDTNSALTSSNDLVMSAINHPAGHVAQFWVDRISYLCGQAPDAWGGIPPDIADYLAELIAHDTKRSQAVETVFGEHLRFFYGADTDWCKQFLLPRFDWSNEARATRLWDGYLSHGGWTRELLFDGLLQGLVDSVGHREKLVTRARHVPLLLANIAVETDIDPRSWSKDLLTTGSTDDHVAWAEAVGHQLKSLEPELVEKQWDRWIRDYLTDRISSIPRKLDPREASAMARWALFLTDSMTAAIDLLLRTETAGFELHSLFFHDLHDAQIERAPEHVAQLIEHNLTVTKPPFYDVIDLKRAYTKLKECGVSDSTLHKLAEAAMQLEIELD